MNTPQYRVIPGKPMIQPAGMLYPATHLIGGLAHTTYIPVKGIIEGTWQGYGYGQLPQGYGLARQGKQYSPQVLQLVSWSPPASGDQC